MINLEEHTNSSERSIVGSSERGLHEPFRVTVFLYFYQFLPPSPLVLTSPLTISPYTDLFPAPPRACTSLLPVSTPLSWPLVGSVLPLFRSLALYSCIRCSRTIVITFNHFDEPQVDVSFIVSSIRGAKLIFESNLSRFHRCK